jgi:hypothetical protein
VISWKTCRTRWAAAALLAIGCGPDVDQRAETSTSDPERLAIVDAPCEGCTFGLEEVAVLGDLNDPVAIRDDAASRDCMVVRAPGGDFLVSGLVGGGEVARFRADGTFSQAFGRRGQGPGELGSDLRISGATGDSIFVFDHSQARAGVYDGSGGFARSFTIPGAYRPWTRRHDGSLVFAPDPTKPGDSAFTVLSADGASLGTIARPAGRDESPPLDSWVVSASSDRGLWAAGIWDYEIFHIGAEGRTDRVLSREASWFPPGGTFQDGMPTTVRPPPVLRFAREISPGVLMVVAVVPDEAWEPNVSPQPNHEWGRRVFDTRIEIIDIEAGGVVASTVRDEWLGAVCDSDLMYSVAEGRDLSLRLRVVRPVLSLGPS